MAPMFIFIFGALDNNLKYLIILTIIDFLTGLFSLYITKTKNGSTGIKGTLKKISYFAIIAVSVILGNIMKMGSSLRNIVIYSLIFAEVVSILNNCKSLGITKLPVILVNTLKELKDRANLEDSSNENMKD